MKTNILLLFTLLYSSVTYSQNSLKGKILIENGKSLQGATIDLKLKDKVYSSISNQEGNFRLDNLESGNYSFSVSSIGYSKAVSFGCSRTLC
jgi:iron complex outermembrane receptor protein